MIAKEILNDSLSFSNDLPLPSKLTDSNEFMDFEEYSKILEEANQDSDKWKDLTKDNNVKRLFDTYFTYHFSVIMIHRILVSYSLRNLQII